MNVEHIISSLQEPATDNVKFMLEAAVSSGINDWEGVKALTSIGLDYQRVAHRKAPNGTDVNYLYTGPSTTMANTTVSASA